MNPPPILLYHKITRGWDVSVCLTSPAAFRSQMRKLYQAGWQGIPLREWNGRERDFIIAFDDGYQCIADFALEILTEFGFRASVFFPTAYLGRFNDWDHQVYGLKFRHLDKEGLKRLVDAGWELGSHSVSHRSLLDIDENAIDNELITSKRILEDISGQIVESISFPFGRYDRHIIERSVSAGYKLGLAPRLEKQINYNDKFKLYEADAVYMWDRMFSLDGRLRREGLFYSMGRRFRKVVNRASAGTVIYQRMSSIGRKNLP